MINFQQINRCIEWCQGSNKYHN